MTPPPTVHGDLAAPATSVIGAAIARDRRRVLADLLALAKPRVVLMILVTTAVGYYAGLTGAPDYARLLHVLVGTLLAAGGALALNHRRRRARRAPARDRLGGGPRGLRRRRVGPLRDPLPVATPAHARDRPAVPRRLRPRRCPPAAGRGRRREQHRAADRDGVPCAPRGEPPADADRHRGSGLLRRRVPPGRGVRRAGRPAGAGTFDGRGAPRAVRVTPLSAGPPGPPGVRQGMTADVKNRQTLWVLLAIIGALVVASFLVGVRW